MVMTLALANSAIHAYSAMKDSLMKQSWSPRQIPAAFHRDTGANAVPSVVQDMKKIAARRSETTYGLALELNADILVSQRAVEYLYPIRIGQLGQQQRFVFSRSVLDAMTGCVLVDREPEIQLYECRE
jgi:hypothetical protein